MSTGPSQHGNQPFAPIADFIVRARWLWVAMTVLLVAFSVAKIANVVPLNPDARIFFAEETRIGSRWTALRTRSTRTIT